jgi:hypothetical protein
VQAQSPDMDVHGERESPLHEPSAIRLRGMLWFFFWFFLGLIVLHIFLYWLYHVYLADAAKESVPITGLTGSFTRSVPPEPRLQPSIDHDQLPRIDMDAMHARDAAEFRRRGWLAEQSDQVIIPQSIIDQVTRMSQAPGTTGGATTRRSQ